MDVETEKLAAEHATLAPGRQELRLQLADRSEILQILQDNGCEQLASLQALERDHEGLRETEEQLAEVQKKLDAKEYELLI